MDILCELKKSKVKTIKSIGINKVRDVTVYKNQNFISSENIIVHNCNSTQPALRNFMEEFSKNCGFILTCNYKNKIIEPLHSRCSVIEFRIPKEERPKLAAEFFARSCKILEEENIPYDKKVLAEVIQKHFPDWRRCLNELQRYSATGKIDVGILSNFQESNINKLISEMKDKNFTNVRKWIAENSDIEYSEFFRKFYDISSEKFSKKTIPNLVLILSKYQYQSAFVADQEINLAAMCVEIMMECEIC